MTNTQGDDAPANSAPGARQFGYRSLKRGVDLSLAKNQFPLNAFQHVAVAGR